MKTINYSQLKSLGACAPQLHKFSRLFGSKVAIIPTLELCVRHAQAFHWMWAAEHLLTPPAHALFSKSRTEAWSLYYDSCDETYKLYKSGAKPYEFWDESCAAAWLLYNKSCAVAFYKAFVSKENQDLCHETYQKSRERT